MLMLSAVALSTSASPLQDVPEALGDALDTTDFVAKMILSIGMLMSLAMVLAVLQLHPVGIILAMISAVTMLVAIAWLDLWVLFILCVVSVVAFASKGKEWFAGSGG